MAGHLAYRKKAHTHTHTDRLHYTATKVVGNKKKYCLFVTKYLPSGLTDIYCCERLFAYDTFYEFIDFCGHLKAHSNTAGTVNAIIL